MSNSESFHDAVPATRIPKRTRPSTPSPRTLDDLQDDWLDDVDGEEPQVESIIRSEVGKLLTMGEVEERLLRADDELAELTHHHMRLAERAASCEADWKSHRDRIIVQIAASGDKMAADMREAKARQSSDPVTGKSGDELYREYKISEAAAESSARAMRALEARISAFQTIASNLRSVAT